MRNKVNILDFLPTGAENALTAKELQALAGYKTTRHITQEIHDLRVRGIAICSDNNYKCQGYFLPANIHEVERCNRQMKSRIYKIQKANKSLEDYIYLNGGER